jgi:hypothetical protein
MPTGEQSRPWFSYIFLPDPDQKNKNRDDKTVDEKHHRRIFSYIYIFFDELYP